MAAGVAAGEDSKRSGKGEGGGGGIRITSVALAAVRGGEISVHQLGVGGSLCRTVERVHDIVEPTLENAFEAWQARQTRQEKSGASA